MYANIDLYLNPNFTEIKNSLVNKERSNTKKIRMTQQIYELILFCLEFNISKNSIRIMTVDQFDSNVLKDIEATDLEDIGIPSLVEAHMIVNSAKAKFLGIHSRSPPIP